MIYFILGMLLGIALFLAALTLGLILKYTIQKVTRYAKARWNIFT